MNPLLKVSPTLVQSIQQEHNIASYCDSYVYNQIDRYISMCDKDVQAEGEPKKHHRIPEFLLKDYAGGVAGGGEIQALRYTLDENGHLLIDSLANQTASGFSKIRDFYSIHEFYEQYENELAFGGNDKYRIEKFLAVIEGNASSMIKLRQKKSFYQRNSLKNPYLYPENMETHRRNKSSSILDTTTGRRIALAVFFAAQYLRSSRMHKHFLSKKEFIKQEYDPHYGTFQGEFFPDWIRFMLPRVAKLFYSRAWRWLYSSHDGFMPEGTSVVPLLPLYSFYAPAAEHSLVMPLGRNSNIIFMESDTFWENHDGVFTSNSLGVSDWIIYKFIQSLSYDVNLITKKLTQMHETTICMHPKTTLAHLFKTKQKENISLKNEIDFLAKNDIISYQEINFLGLISRINS